MGERRPRERRLVFGGSLVVLGFASSFLWVVLLLVLVNAVGSVGLALVALAAAGAAYFPRLRRL